MLQKPFIKLRDLKEMQCIQKQRAENDKFITPFKYKIPRRSQTTTATPIGEVNHQTPTDPVVVLVVLPSTPTAKRPAKSARKDLPPSQLRIDSFFKNCEKSYKIEPLKEQPATTISKKAYKARGKRVTSTAKNSCNPHLSSGKMRRKRLFDDETSESGDESASNDKNSVDPDWEPDDDVSGPKSTSAECITVILDSDEEEMSNEETDIQCNKTNSTKESTPQSNLKKSCLPRVSTLGASIPSMDDCGSVQNLATPNVSTAVANLKTPATPKRKPKPCPPYKIVEGTTFAVDAFQYGCIAEVTHYFLTHFHADHYVGLTKKFAMPLYMSTITARLVRTFIPIDEQYIHELELNKPIILDNVEITALDANHCPGAIMLLFKFVNTGKCILHTGDFRAWHGMESEPDFWHNDIHTIYLDTTYISHKYAFCTQYESIDKAKDLIDKFREKHSTNRILYVCGSYMIGKEKFWSAIAEEYELKVWTENNRSKALKSIDDRDLNKFLVDDPKNADMHVIAMAKMSYLSLVEYFCSYEHEYDKLLAIRPSGWEKDSKPQYRGKINIIGVEYSEHSSYEEMQRFVKFLKPQKVISTVPTGRNLMRTATVPEKWYKYEKLQNSSNYQPCIEQFLGKTPHKKPAIRLPNERRGGLETFVSPLKKKPPRAVTEINNNYDEDTIASLKSYENDLAQSLPGHTNPFAIQANSSDYQESTNNVSSTIDKDVVNQEFNEGNEELKKNNKSVKSISQRATSQIKNEPIAPENQTDLVIIQSLNDGESCSILIPTSSEFQPVSRANSSDFFESPSFIKKNGRCKDVIQPVSKTNSSVYFEPTTSKSRKRCGKDSSSSGEEIPVSQKRNTRLTSKLNKAPSVPSTMDEDELEVEIQLLKSSENQISTLKQEEITASLKVTQTNPLLKSTTTSNASSTNENIAALETGMDLKNIPTVIENKTFSHNEEIPASQTTNDLANTPRPLRNRIKNALSQIYLSENEEIPASQTTNDLANTPRPLRNKMKLKISASQTTNDLANTPRPLRNKMKLAYLWETTDQDDVIPASQTSNDLQNTPRPLRNKRKNPNICSSLVATSPLISPKEIPLNNTVKRGRFTAPASYTQPRSLAQILEENEAIDIYEAIDLYDISQSAKIVAETLANQEPDTSVDHIPSELLSSPDLDVDFEEYKDVKPVKQIDVCKVSQLVGLVVDAPSKQRADKSVDNVKLESLSSPDLDLDSEDDEHVNLVKQINVYKTSQLVGLVVDAMSQQQPDKSVDHIPPELLSPTDQDADDDWLY